MTLPHPDGGTAGRLAEKIEITAGDIVDESGAEVGQHPGRRRVHGRRAPRFEAGTPAADGKPRFALEFRPKENKVAVVPEALLAIDELRGIKVSWAGLPIAEVAHRRVFVGMPRSGHVVTPCPSRRIWTRRRPRASLVVTLTEPLRGVVPARPAVLYQGNRAPGQATIDAARSLQRAAL